MFNMSTTIYCFSLVVFAASFLKSETSEQEKYEIPYEEDECNFPYQNALQAVNINGKIYVKSQNFNATFPPLCDSAERVVAYNETNYVFTLAAVIPQVPNVTVKFNTSLVLSKTGNHCDYNAMTYMYETTGPPKLRKLMYMNNEKSCMIFVDERNSTAEKARCQLLQPVEYADQDVPRDCEEVYKKECPGPSKQVYFPWCKNLPEIPVHVLQHLKTTKPPGC